MQKWQLWTITPKMATEIWNAQSPQRRELLFYHPERADELARIMQEGRWQTRPYGIVFREDGSLEDGQHRLNAIRISGVTVRMWVYC